MLILLFWPVDMRNGILLGTAKLETTSQVSLLKAVVLSWRALNWTLCRECWSLKLRFKKVFWLCFWINESPKLIWASTWDFQCGQYVRQQISLRILIIWASSWDSDSVGIYCICDKFQTFTSCLHLNHDSHVKNTPYEPRHVISNNVAFWQV